MSETQTPFNPYAADQMLEGGGLTRDIVVTSAKYIIEQRKRKDGTPVKDDKTGELLYFIGLRIEGLSTDPKAEGKVAKYDFSSGKKAKPSPDGEMLLDEKGNPAKLYKTSNLGRAIEALRQGGLDPALLYPKVSYLVGAKITLAGFDQKDKDGKVKTYVGTDGKTHNSIEWFPEKYNGGAGSRTGAAAGNGAAPDAIVEKATKAVQAAIIAAGGEIIRKDLIRALGTSLKDDADAIKVTTLVAQQAFHQGKPWTFDGEKLALAQA